MVLSHNFLPGASLVSLSDACGLRLTCERGAVWITYDADPADIVLGAGESLRIDRNQRMLVSAFGDAEVSLDDAQPCQAPARAGASRYSRPRRTSAFSISTATNTVAASSRQVRSSLALSGAVLKTAFSAGR